MITILHMIKARGYEEYITSWFIEPNLRYLERPGLMSLIYYSFDGSVIDQYTVQGNMMVRIE